jgi:peptidoglycan hydrolase CwlO-like protein
MIDLMEILTFVGGLMVTIIGYFLKRTMDELKEVKQVTYINATKIEVMQNDYMNKITSLNDKFELLAETIRDLNHNIKELNEKIHKLK